MKSTPETLQIPNQTSITNKNGEMSQPWESFFRGVQSSVDPLGSERHATIVNNQSSAANVEGLSFSYKSVSQATVDYLIQRVTTGGGAVEQIETGVFYLVYKPTSNTWVLSSGPSSAGVTLSVTSAGQVQYTSTNVGGTASISKITFRARTLAAKNSLYSTVGK